MKKYSLINPFKSNFFKEQDPFHLVLVFFIIFFGTAIFFSIPTFYDYDNYKEKIKNTINKEYKINTYNLDDISFKFIPSPHLLIKKAHLKIDNGESDDVSVLKNIKVFISITELYKSDKFKIKKVLINKANLYLNKQSLINFIKNLKKNIVNNLIISNSTLFYKNDQNEIILISKVKNLNYKIDFVNNKKNLKIEGNVFDSNYKFFYEINYKQPNIQNVLIEFKKPNITIVNELIENFNSNSIDQKGKIIFEFLNQKNSINYVIKDDNISFKNLETKNFNFDLNGSVNFNPFHFNLMIDLKKNNLIDIEKLLYWIYKNKNLKFKNLSGDLVLNFNNIDNKAISKNQINLLFENSNLLVKNNIFIIDDFAEIKVVDFEYLENNDQILQLKAKVNILDSTKFNRFMFNFKKNKISSKNLYFTYQFNSGTGSSFISQVSDKGFNNNNQFYKFNNLQQLKNLFKDENFTRLD